MAVLKYALFAAVARLWDQVPGVDELLSSMNNQEALRDGSRSL